MKRSTVSRTQRTKFPGVTSELAPTRTIGPRPRDKSRSTRPGRPRAAPRGRRRPASPGRFAQFVAANPTFVVDRDPSHGSRLDIPAAALLHDEPGVAKVISLVTAAARRGSTPTSGSGARMVALGKSATLPPRRGGHPDLVVGPSPKIAGGKADRIAGREREPRPPYASGGCRRPRGRHHNGLGRRRRSGRETKPTTVTPARSRRTAALSRATDRRRPALPGSGRLRPSTAVARLEVPRSWSHRLPPRRPRCPWEATSTPKRGEVHLRSNGARLAAHAPSERFRRASTQRHRRSRDPARQ